MVAKGNLSGVQVVRKGPTDRLLQLYYSNEIISEIYQTLLTSATLKDPRKVLYLYIQNIYPPFGRPKEEEMKRMAELCDIFND